MTAFGIVNFFDIPEEDFMELLYLGLGYINDIYIFLCWHLEYVQEDAKNTSPIYIFDEFSRKHPKN
jgi:hypothetical protein